jgi:hypothetical protein
MDEMIVGHACLTIEEIEALKKNGDCDQDVLAANAIVYQRELKHLDKVKEVKKEYTKILRTSFTFGTIFGIGFVSLIVLTYHVIMG